MKQYLILFYKRKKDTLSCAKYYREFETFEECVNWCNSVRDECRYSYYTKRVISLEKYLAHDLKNHKY